MKKLKTLMPTFFLCAALVAVPNPVQAGEFNEAAAVAFDQRKDYQGMANYCQQWVQQEPNNWGANEYLGVAYYEMKNYKEAVPWFARAVKCNPDNYYPWKQIALSASSYGNQKAAEQALRDGVQYTSNKFDADAWAWFGSAFGACHQWSDAINCWQRAYDMRPTPNEKECLAAVYFNRGKDEAFANKIDEAEADCRKAASLGNVYAKQSLPELAKFKSQDVPILEARKRAVEAEKAKWANALKYQTGYIGGGSGGMVNFGQMEFRRNCYQQGHPGTLDTHASY